MGHKQWGGAQKLAPREANWSAENPIKVALGQFLKNILNWSLNK